MNKPTTKRGHEAADMKNDLPIEVRFQSARTALHIALLDGGSNTAELRQVVRSLEAEAQTVADAQAADEAAARDERNAAEAEREASIRAASKTLLESRNARLDIVRKQLTVTRAIPDTRSSFV